MGTYEQITNAKGWTTLWANSADDMMVFFLYFSVNRIWHFIFIVSWWDNLHEMSSPFFWKKKKKKEKKNISNCHLLKFLHILLRINIVIPKETICMKCRSLFSGKNKKNISKCCLLKILSSLLSNNIVVPKTLVFVLIIIEPGHDKTYLCDQTCVISKDSYQPVYPPSMARVLI